MLNLILLFTHFLVNNPSQTWLTDFNKAKIQAVSEHKYILLSFSGSDWCIPCIKMKRDYFNSSEFLSYAEKHLILVNADFPRKKKNKLSAEVQKQNEFLASQFNKSAIFPMTLLLNEKGEVLKSWEGLVKMSQRDFVKELCQIK